MSEPALAEHITRLQALLEAAQGFLRQSDISEVAEWQQNATAATLAARTAILAHTDENDRLAAALHRLCAAVRCNYDPHTIASEGYLAAGLAALRTAGYDPDRPLPARCEEG